MPAKARSLDSMEKELTNLQKDWLVMDRKKLQVAKKGGVVVHQIKVALKKQGKKFSDWCADKEQAGFLRVTQRTLQKWMRVNKKWPAIEAKARHKKLDPDDLGLDEALALATRPAPRTIGKVDPSGNGEGPYKPEHQLKLTCEVSAVVRTDLTAHEVQSKFRDGGFVLKVELEVLDQGGRSLMDLKEVECAPEVVVADMVDDEAIEPDAIPD
jgi:hypothetical protein